MSNRRWLGRRRAQPLAEAAPEANEAPRGAFRAEAWPLLPDICPCDSDFVAYLTEHRLQGRRIFHFGTGRHHLVGLDNWRRGQPNDILAVTASPAEHQHYVELVSDQPALGVHYKVMLADIYTWTPALAAGFDLVTLFHLGEFFTEAQRAYAPLDDASLLDLFVGALSPGGRLAVYPGSWGYHIAGPLLDAHVAAGRLTPAESYAALQFYIPRA